MRRFLSQAPGTGLKLALLCLALFAIRAPLPAAANDDIGITFVNVIREARVSTKTIYGGERKNRYLLETTGCGAAFLDYDAARLDRLLGYP